MGMLGRIFSDPLALTFFAFYTIGVATVAVGITAIISMKYRKHFLLNKIDVFSEGVFSEQERTIAEFYKREKGYLKTIETLRGRQKGITSVVASWIQGDCE